MAEHSILNGPVVFFFLISLIIIFFVVVIYGKCSIAQWYKCTDNIFILRFMFFGKTSSGDRV